MAVRTYKPEPRIEVKARITEDLHGRLIAECGHCGCHLNGFIAVAIANEIAARKSKRRALAQAGIVKGQLEFEGQNNAE